METRSTTATAPVCALITMDDWFALARRYPEYKTHSRSLLKDYGVMAIRAFVEDAFQAPIRLLELGHGFNADVLRLFDAEHECWGCDRDNSIDYMAGIDWQARFDKLVRSACPNTRFVPELLGTDEGPSAIPSDYFDVICSISMLENIHPAENMWSVIEAAFDRLKPGGWFLNTHDMNTRWMPRYGDLVEMLYRAGFEVGHVDDPDAFDLRTALLEHPASVMLWYQQATPEGERSFSGHWATAWVAARKPG